jgi:hypothetical protein
MAGLRKGKSETVNRRTPSQCRGLGGALYDGAESLPEELQSSIGRFECTHDLDPSSLPGQIGSCFVRLPATSPPIVDVPLINRSQLLHKRVCRINGLDFHNLRHVFVSGCSADSDSADPNVMGG